MTVRNLQYIFKPKSVALIGASRDPRSVGGVIGRNLLTAGFNGTVYRVNPRFSRDEEAGIYPSIHSLPKAPELAVIATPAATVPDVVGELAAKGTQGAVVISAGFAELRHGKGRRLQQQLLEISRPHLMRIIGPNCLGLMVPGIGLNASFAHRQPLAGHLAFAAQSGAIVTAVLDWATSRGIGFSQMISTGDMADVDFGDLLDYLSADPETSAILLYIEAVRHARKFMSAARAASRVKPVIVVKGGRFSRSARAAATHTGALAGTDGIYDAAIRRAGMLRVAALSDLFDAVETLANRKSVSGENLAILTNGGGVGVLAADALLARGGVLANLAGSTRRALDRVLPAFWSHDNPVDIMGDAGPERYAAALDALGNADEVDAILVLNSPTAVSSSTTAAERVAAHEAARRKFLCASWLGGETAEPGRRALSNGRIPNYETPDQAVNAFMQLVDYRRSQQALMQIVPSVPEQFVPRTREAQELIRRALTEKREWLDEAEAKTVLSAYGIPVAETLKVKTADDAAAAVAHMSGPVALKIVSPDITHKSEVGGVSLNLDSPEAVRQAALGMKRRFRELRPQARISGFTVQPMVRRPGAFELIAGAIDDPVFGPVMVFGQGGVAVEVLGDTVFELPPLNMALAQAMMRRTRIFSLLSGYRHEPAADLDALAVTLIKVSRLVTDLGEIAELDVNPLLVDSQGVVALDARIRIRDRIGPADQRLAIRPYPRELEKPFRLPDGRALQLRPIRPEDEPALIHAFSQLGETGRYRRLFGSVRELSHAMAARMTQIDYDREMALVIEDRANDAGPEILGEVRLIAEPDNDRAQFAIMVVDRYAGKGIGTRLMEAILAYARQRGIQEVYGHVLAENAPMLAVCDALGFACHREPDDQSVVVVSLNLAARGRPAEARRQPR